MKKEKLAKNLEIIFLISATATVLEFIFIQGLFTWLIVVAATIISGSLNIILKIINKNWQEAYFYLIFVIALTMGYFTILF